MSATEIGSVVARVPKRDEVARDELGVGQGRTPLGAWMVGASAMTSMVSSSLAMASAALWDRDVGWQWQAACCWPAACGGMETFLPLAWDLRKTARRDGTWSKSDRVESGYGGR